MTNPSNEELTKFRWKALGSIGVNFDYIKRVIDEDYNENVSENSLEDFINIYNKKYKQINHQEILFKLEDVSYKKVFIFTIREKELEELKLPHLDMLLRINHIEGILNNENIAHIGENMYPCFLKSDDKYVTIKMCQLRLFMYDEFGENGEFLTTEHRYYHCTKFIVDLTEGLVFLFYNDVDNRETSRGTAVTEKKNAFYTLFLEGNQQTLITYRLESYLNRYVKNHLKCLNDNSDINDITISENKDNKVILIETSDPVNTKNNLRSSKSDGRHNEFRLKAIKYALEEEDHNIKTLGCNINKRWVQLKDNGEIIANGPYFDKGVIRNVCKEIFPEYKLPEPGEIRKEAQN